ncbi:Eco57I restriction-modification methylase domain-containing protein [Segnochrobactraceae bacterium EtOH-i3]
MARTPVTDLAAWPSLTLEGNLIAPAMVAQIATPKEDADTRQGYGVRRGLTLREEISTAFRVGQAHMDAFARLPAPSADATRRFVRDFLTETFGFADLVPGDGAIALVAGERVPVVVVPPDEEKLDRRSPTLSTDRPRSPAYALQDFLNDEDGALWGLVTNGRVLRLMRDNASLTRPAFIEADLAQIFASEDAASFAVLWLLIHRSRFGATGTPASDCALERWREAGAREGEAARDRLAGQVREALQLLGTGFLVANPELAARLASGALPLTDWFNELLRLVYRLIFLMVAEDRDLLHPEDTPPAARGLYAEGYSLTALRQLSTRGSAWDRHSDRFEGLRIVFRALAFGEPALGLPALGGLFAPDQLPHLEAARLGNRALLEALYRLSWLKEKSGRVPVNWRAMQTEELGSVYESLLELQPQLGDDGRSLVFAASAAEQKGNQRKTTGSYYTPDSLVQALLDTALDPVLDRTEAQADDPEAALLKLAVIDPACGSGHFLLAAGRRIATRLARLRAEGTPALADFRHALRDVARACLHGVDRNPMAVELTKVALWIETVDPGRPLGFFDAQIRCGDALLGVFDLTVLDEGLPEAAFKPLSGDDKDTATYYLRKNRRERAEKAHVESGLTLAPARDLGRAFAALRAMPEDSVGQIADKAAARVALMATDAAGWRLARACDLYTAAFLLPKRRGGAFAGPDGLPARGRETVPTSGTLWEWLRGVAPFGPLFGAAIEAAGHARAFHWPLEFPDVMGRGGFDVVLGNPPWERIKLQEQEFFAARSPEIASAPNKATRDRLIKALATAPDGSPDRRLSEEFLTARREAEATSAFVRVEGAAGGRFPLTGRGDVNTYALFAELFSRLARQRAGVIVPTGIATDATTAPFFSALVTEKRLFSLFSFKETRALFPATDDRSSFCLLTLCQDGEAARFAFSLLKTEQITDPERNFTLSPEAIAAINPNTRTAPVFRSRADAELTAKIYARAPVLIDESKGAAGNPWGVSFLAMFHMSNDSGLFRTAAQLAAAGCVRVGTDWEHGATRFVPLYEAKMIHQFDHRWAGYAGNGVDTASFDAREKADPTFEPAPRYWVPEEEVTGRLAAKGWNRGWLMGWRDIARATDERTTISSIIPRVACGDKYLLLLPNATTKLCTSLHANLNSLIFDYVARQKLGGTSYKYFTMRQNCALPPAFYTDARLTFVTPRVLELTYTSFSLAPFARDLGFDGPPFPWDEARRAELRAELDAFYARAYDLTRDELRYILDPADVRGPDYPSETFRVLKEKEIRQFGDYRTRRLVLAAWDRMESEGTFADLGFGTRRVAQTSLCDDAWIRTRHPADASAALAAVLKLIDEPVPSNTIHLAVALMLEPSLLTPRLPDEQAREWRRLVGQDAEPRAGNVVAFSAHINAGWRAAVTNHRGNGRLIEDLSAGTWAPGTGLEKYETAGWPDGRAGFILNTLRTLDLQTTISSMPDDVRDWITHAAAG